VNMKLKTKKPINRVDAVVPGVPLKLNLGSGPTKMDGFISVDSIKFHNVDVVTDLNNCWPWLDNSVEEVHASHVIEHFDAIQRVHFYNELWRVLKVGAKATLIAPHWSSGRAYGDPTHKFPPIAGFSFFYLLKSWRMAQAPHTDFQHWPQGYKCDLDCTWGFSLHPQVASRNQEYQQHALTFWIEAAQDVIYTLVKRPA